MTVQEAIRTRKSIRKYKADPIEPEKLERVMEAGWLAPSAVNRQMWKFIYVTDTDKIMRLQDKACYGQKHVGMAPAFIAVCGVEDERRMPCGQYATSLDCSIAMSFILLAAQEEGLGMCWLGRFDEQPVRDILNIPDNYRVVAVSPIGYRDEDPERRPRKDKDTVICHDSFK